MLNKVSLIGYLGADPEVRHLETGAAVARLRVATSESYKDKEGNWQNLTEWHTVILWRDLAERAAKYLKKGSLAYIEGKITYRTWEDKDKQQRTSTEIVASAFRLLEKREKDGSNETEDHRFPNEDPFHRGSAPKKEGSNMPPPPPIDTPDDDLPF
jgi:single-strand DNA-binding protein